MLKNNNEVVLKSQKEIMNGWMSSKVTISIICTTYNHEDYVEDTIKGFLMQETSRPFEVIIHDDASTDKTTSIIENYRKEYDKIIKVIYQESNQYSINVNIPLKLCFKVAKGEYIAFCEGDDFWYCKNKLEMQAKILSENKKIGLVITDFNMLYQDKSSFREACFKNRPKQFPFFDTFEKFLIGRSYMAPCTWLLRSELFYQAKYQTLDATFCWLLDVLKTHEIYLLPNATTTYRVLSESASHSSSFNKMLRRETDIYNMQILYAKENSLDKTMVNKINLKHVNKTFHLNLALGNRGEVVKARKVFWNLKPRVKVLCVLSYLPFSGVFMKVVYKYKNIFK